MTKVVKGTALIECTTDGAPLMVGGFMAVGSPLRLIGELVRQGKKGLALNVHDTDRPGAGVGQLMSASRVWLERKGAQISTQDGL